ncbi:M23 family metallopeptidase [Paenibacillus guangzhouensis]|uniref:M23 family metallopeptidase n=1 Tax=Paenibacillus guangzhouensis TaxID=1473112 RepID=UPI001267128F|nr:M23 family metallopeptidase [Paenibacillus guangzhouensis]
MKKRWFTSKMTLLVIRDADQSVRQIEVPMLLVISVPLITAVSLTSFVLGLEMRSSSQIEGLQGKISANATASANTIEQKDHAITSLQNEVIELSSDAQMMKEGIERIHKMEKTLQGLIRKYGKTESTNDSSVTPLPWDATEDVGGEYFPVSNEEILRLAQDTAIDLEQMETVIQVMQQNVSKTVERVQDVFQNTPTGWPTTSHRLTSNFGYRRDPMTGRAAYHAGVDIAGKVGDPVFAAADGKVITTGSDNSRGKYIVIEHAKGYDTWYMHLSRIEVDEGDVVVKGDRIGRLGNTGRSTGPHLHFQIAREDQLIDPLPFITKPKEE